VRLESGSGDILRAKHVAGSRPRCNFCRSTRELAAASIRLFGKGRLFHRLPPINATVPSRAHAIAMESVARLLAANETVCFTPQNISEFWNVVTRPAAYNGLGFSISLMAGPVDLCFRGNRPDIWLKPTQSFRTKKLLAIRSRPHMAKGNPASVAVRSTNCLAQFAARRLHLYSADHCRKATPV
jgi:hypothetical protein